MKIDRFYTNTEFVFGACAFMASSIAKIVMLPFRASKIECITTTDSNSHLGLSQLSEKANNFFQSCEWISKLLPLREKINNVVCEEKPYEVTNAERALDDIFFVSLGYIAGYSISYIFLSIFNNNKRT